MAVQRIEDFYDVSGREPRNRDLVSTTSGGGAPRILTPLQEVALRRRASFLLNEGNLNELSNALLALTGPQRSPSSSAHAVTLINALATGVMDHVREVKTAAVDDALQGRRICPLTLKPLAFKRFLEENAPTLRRIVAATTLDPDAREIRMTQALQDFALAYLCTSAERAMAAERYPKSVAVDMHSAHDSSYINCPVNGSHAIIRFDCNDADADFCNAPFPNEVSSDDTATLLRIHLLQGFEDYPPAKKLALLHIQLALLELAELEEKMGIWSLSERNEVRSAQEAAKRTQEEWNYAGSTALGDSTVLDDTGTSQRGALLEIFKMLPIADGQLIRRLGASLFEDPALQAWIHSPAMQIDLQALEQPRARLLLLQAQTNAEALRQTSVFRAPR